MRWSQTLLNTLREDPQDAEIASHRFMLRSSLIRRLSGGVYTFLPLGLRALRKVETIVREEMDRAGAQEILMPALQPSELWARSGRLTAMGPTMFQLRDRQDRLLIMGPTHEEVITDLAAREISSYRQLPCTLYQIQVKFRDEIRPRFGLMRAKEFIMKDAYSFDPDPESAERSYRTMYDAYERLFRRCGLNARVVEADSGDMGGSSSHEFMVLAESGEDGLVECSKCDYAANQERAERQLPEATGGKDPSHDAMPEEVDTPGPGTIQHVSEFLKCDPARLLKTIIYLADDSPIAVVVAGNREVNEAKLKRGVNAKTLLPADPETILQVTGAPVGFAGPIGLSIPVYADSGLRGVSSAVCGANKDEKHMLNVCLDRDARVRDYMDLVVVKAGDACPRCGTPLGEKRGIEVGHVFNLGTKYTEAFDASFLDEQGIARTMIMGCYGIGITRTLQSIIEQCHDADGICWPVSVAPYTVGLLLLDPGDAQCCNVAENLETELTKRGLDVFVDDRKERPGVKFKDADLLGFPIRVVVGARSLAKGAVEIKQRTSVENDLLAPETAAQRIVELVEEETRKLFADSVP